MKKSILFIAFILMSFYSNAQLCTFTTTQAGSPNNIIFVPSISPSLANASILWNFGDGSSIISTQPTHVFTQLGNYAVTMSLLDSTNANTLCAYTQVVSVSFCNVSYFQDSTNSFIYYFSDLTNGTFSQVDWDFGDNTVGNGSSVAHQYTSPGIYNVICTESVNGVVFCTTSMIIQVGSACSYQVSSPSPNSPAYVKEFTAIIPNSAGNVVWDFGDGTPVVTGPVVQKGFASAGTYNVCMYYLFGTDTCNYCSQVVITNGPSGGSCNFTVNQTGNSAFDFVPSNLNSGNTFEFNFGDGVTQTTSSIINHSYFSAGVYTVCMNELDSNGVILCNYCLPIVVQSPASNCQANFAFTHVGFDAYFVNMTVANPVLGTPVAYSWDFGDGGTSTSAFPHHVYSGYGFYNVCLTVTTANCTNTYCNVILIDTTNNPNGTPCSAQFVFTQISPYLINAVVLYPGTSYNYSWDFGDGSPLVSQLYTTHSYSNPGTYNVCLTMASAFVGCTSVYCDTLTVDSLGNIIYKGINTGFSLQTTTPTVLTGLDNNVIANTIQLLPNPAHSQITISGNTSEINSYVLMNVIGQQIESGSFINQNYTIDVNELSQGVYLLKLIDKNGNSINQKFLKN
jgi:PKD repeat protein